MTSATSLSTSILGKHGHDFKDPSPKRLKLSVANNSSPNSVDLNSNISQNSEEADIVTTSSKLPLSLSDTDIDIPIVKPNLESEPNIGLDRINIKINDKTQSFKTSSLTKLSYFNAILAKRWEQKDGKQRKTVELESMQFEIIHFAALITVINDKKISLQYPCTKDFLEKLLICDDFFTNNIISNDIIKEFLLDFKPRISVKQRKRWQDQTSHKKLQKILSLMNSETVVVQRKQRRKWTKNNIPLMELERSDSEAVGLFIDKFDFEWEYIGSGSYYGKCQLSLKCIKSEKNLVKRIWSRIVDKKMIVNNKVLGPRIVNHLLSLYDKICINIDSRHDNCGGNKRNNNIKSNKRRESKSKDNEDEDEGSAGSDDGKEKEKKNDNDHDIDNDDNNEENDEKIDIKSKNKRKGKNGRNSNSNDSGDGSGLGLVCDGFMNKFRGDMTAHANKLQQRWPWYSWTTPEARNANMYGSYCCTTLISMFGGKLETDRSSFVMFHQAMIGSALILLEYKQSKQSKQNKQNKQIKRQIEQCKFKQTNTIANGNTNTNTNSSKNRNKFGNRNNDTNNSNNNNSNGNNRDSSNSIKDGCSNDNINKVAGMKIVSQTQKRKSQQEKEQQHVHTMQKTKKKLARKRDRDRDNDSKEERKMVKNKLRHRQKTARNFIDSIDDITMRHIMCLLKGCLQYMIIDDDAYSNLNGWFGRIIALLDTNSIYELISLMLKHNIITYPRSLHADFVSLIFKHGDIHELIDNNSTLMLFFKSMACNEGIEFIENELIGENYIDENIATIILSCMNESSNWKIFTDFEEDYENSCDDMPLLEKLHATVFVPFLDICDRFTSDVVSLLSKIIPILCEYKDERYNCLKANVIGKKLTFEQNSYLVISVLPKLVILDNCRKITKCKKWIVKMLNYCHLDTLMSDNGSVGHLIKLVCEDDEFLKWFQKNLIVNGKPNGNLSQRNVELVANSIGDYIFSDDCSIDPVGIDDDLIMFVNDVLGTNWYSEKNAEMKLLKDEKFQFPLSESESDNSCDGSSSDESNDSESL